MTSQDQLERIVGMLHDAALGDVPWTVPACTINEIVRTRGNSLVIGRGSSAADAQIFFSESCYGNERRTDHDKQYFSEFYHRDERVPRALRLPDAQLIPSGRLYTEQEKKTSPAYNRTWWRTKKSGLHVRLDGSTARMSFGSSPTRRNLTGAGIRPRSRRSSTFCRTSASFARVRGGAG